MKFLTPSITQRLRRIKRPKPFKKLASVARRFARASARFITYSTLAAGLTLTTANCKKDEAPLVSPASETDPYYYGSDSFLQSFGITCRIRNLDGAGDQLLHDIQPTIDGGSVAVGVTTASSKGGFDIWVAKLDPTGEVQWQKKIGESGHDYGHSIKQTPNGDYILTGSINTRTLVSRNDQIYVAKLDSNGKIVKEATFGGGHDDSGSSIEIAKDGGYILVATRQRAKEGSLLETDSDILVLKLNEDLGVEWQRTIGDVDLESAASITSTADGYIVSGNVTYTGFLGQEADAALFVHLDAEGEILWERLFDGMHATDICPTPEGSYVVSGVSLSAPGFGQGYLRMRFDPDEDGHEWKMTLTPANGVSNKVVRTSDGGFILFGEQPRPAIGGETTVMYAYVMKVDADGNMEWDYPHGGTSPTYATSGAVLADGSVLAAGYGLNSKSGNVDAFVIRLTPDGDLCKWGN